MSQTPNQKTSPTPKKNEPLWKIELSKTVMVPKVCTSKTRCSAPSLEEAHKIAIEKAKKLQEQEPNTVYTVTAVQMA